MSDLTITKEQEIAIIAHAKKETPNECCGILAGKDGLIHKVYMTTNPYASPVKYTYDEMELMEIQREVEDAGLALLCFFHSHTKIEAFPSVTDVKQSSPWEGYTYLIVSLEYPEKPVLRLFSIDKSKPSGDQIKELKLQIK